jgi:hypothetical protein
MRPKSGGDDEVAAVSHLRQERQPRLTGVCLAARDEAWARRLEGDPQEHREFPAWGGMRPKSGGI